MNRPIGLVLLAASGAVLQLGLVMLWTLSYQLSQQPAWTDQYLDRFPLIAQLLQPLLQLGAMVLPHVASPRAPTQLGAWFGPLTLAWALACLVASGGYLGALFLLHRGIASARAALLMIAAFDVVFAATVLSAPGLLSQDIFGYLMYGQIAEVHGMNPYIWPPNAFVRDGLLQWVAPIWRSLPSPYGPVWTDVNWLLAHAVSTWGIVEQVLAYKALALGLFVATLGLLWYLLGRLAPDTRLLAFTAFAWNPLVLVEVIGNGHNDALVLVLLLAGLVPLSAGAHARTPRVLDPSQLTAVVMFLLSGLVKYLSGVAGIFLVLAWLARLRTWPERALQLAAVACIGTVITVALFAPWLELPDSLDPILRQTGGNLYANSVPDLLSLTVADHVLTQHRALADARAQARTLMKVVVDALFLVYLVWEMRQVWRASVGGGRGPVIGLIRATTRAILLLILVVSIWVQPWYFVLPLGLGVLLGARSLLMRISVGYSLTALPAMYVHYYLQDSAPGAIFLAYAGLPLLLLGPRLVRPLSGSRRHDAGLGGRLVHEGGQAIVADTAARATVSELDLHMSDDRVVSS